MTAEAWPRAIYAVFKAQPITLVSFGPDAGHAELIRLCQADPQIQTIPLTTEEEGVALAAGAYLGGTRATLLMQSSGVGNCVNMFALLKTCAFPFLTLITMRGEWGEFNPWQIPMGQSTPAVLSSSGMLVERAIAPADVGPTVDAGARIAFGSYCAVAVLLSQRLIGAKSFGGGNG
jgi:sulfopyruvate decarboxylase alpha subunit